MALMNNSEDLTKAMDMAKDSIGSVDEEMAIVMQSFEKRVEVMKNAWVSLANSTLNSDFIKGIVDTITKMLEMTEACGGLTTAVVALGTAVAFVKFSNFAGGISQIIPKLIEMATTTNIATGALVGLKAVLAGGLVASGIMLVGYAINSIANYAENAKQKVVDLRDEIGSLNTSNQSTKELQNEFLTLSEMENLTEEQTQRLVDVQNQLKNQIPELSGYYDAHGNFVIQNVQQIQEEITATEELIQKKRELLATEQGEGVKNNLEDAQQYEATTKELQEYIRLVEEVKSKGMDLSFSSNKDLSNAGFTESDIELLNRVNTVYGGITNAQMALEEQSKEYANSLDELKQKYVDIVTSSEAYQNATEEERKNIDKNLANMNFGNMGVDGVATAFSELSTNAEKCVSDLAKVKEESGSLADAQNILEDSTVSASERLEAMDTAFQSTLSSFEQTVEELDVLKVALDEMNKSGALSEKTAEKLAKKYPEIFKGCKTATDGIVALNKQLATNKFDEATDKIGMLSDVLSDLEKDGGLTSASFKKLSENFPELLAYMDDTASLTQAIKEETDRMSQAQQQAYSEMLMSSESYYKQKLAQDNNWVKQTEANLNKLISDLGADYQVDLKNYTSMEQAKAEITNQLIAQLGQAWADYFGMIADGMSLGEIEEQAGYANGYDESGGFNVDYEAYNKAKKVYDAFNKLSENFAKFEAPQISVGGSSGGGGSSKSDSKKYASYIDSLYDSQIDAIMAGTEKLERAINLTQGKLETAELMGNDGLTALMDNIYGIKDIAKLDDSNIENFIETIGSLEDQLRSLSELGNVDLTVRPQIDSETMKAQGWDVEDGSISTTFTSGEFVWQGSEEDGEYVYVHYTPILPDGTVFTPEQMDSYLHNTLEHSKDILESDSLGIVMKVDEVALSEEEIKNFMSTGQISEKMAEFLKQTGAWDEKVHQIQEEFYTKSADLSEEGIERLIANGKISVDSEIALRKQLEKQYEEQVKSLESASIQIQSLRNKMVNELSAKNYKEFQGIDITGLSQLDLDKILRDIEKQIDKANMSSNEDLKASLEYKKSLIQDLGSSIIKANDQINNLAKDTIDAKNQLIQLQQENLERTFEIKMGALEREERILSLRKSTLLEDGGDYKKEIKEADQILAINMNMLNTIAKKRKAVEEQISSYRKLGYAEESEQIQSLTDQWLDYEQARLDMIKEIAQQKRQDTIDSAQNELDDLTKAKDHMKSLLDLTINMLKEETNAKKEALKEQYDAKKEALKDDYEAEKKALQDKLALLKEEADARKKALDKESDERDYNRQVAEKQREISTIKQQIAELSVDNSASSIKKRKELEAELAQLQQELRDIQYDRSIELQKEAIDEELDAQSKKIEDELDALEDKYNTELEMCEDNYEKQLKVYEDYLKNQSQLKADASALIEAREQSFYERLKQYAMDYTDTTQAEFENTWNKAYEALENYGNKQMDVLSTIETMTQRMIELNNEIERLNDTTYKDFITDDPNNSNDDYNIGGKEENPWGDKYGGLEEKEERAKYRDEQLKRMIALGDRMDSSNDASEIRSLKAQQESIAKTIGAYRQGDTFYIMINGKKYRVRDAVGVRHTGLETGEVGSPYGSFKLKANEELNKLKNGEIVLNEGQSIDIMKNAKALASGAVVSGGVNVVLDMHDFSITKDSIVDFKKMLKDQIPKIINEHLFSKAIK